MKIKKVSETAPIQAQVVDSMSGTSRVDAPSVNAVKDYIDSFGPSSAALNINILWTNTDIGSAFSAQRVTLSDDLKNYKYFIIKFSTYSERLTYFSESIYKSNDEYSATECSCVFFFNNKLLAASRKVGVVVSASGVLNNIDIDDCNGAEIGQSVSVHSDWLVPMEILGVK